MLLGPKGGGKTVLLALWELLTSGHPDVEVGEECQDLRRRLTCTSCLPAAARSNLRKVQDIVLNKKRRRVPRSHGWTTYRMWYSLDSKRGNTSMAMGLSLSDISGLAFEGRVHSLDTLADTNRDVSDVIEAVVEGKGVDRKKLAPFRDHVGPLVTDPAPPEEGPSRGGSTPFETPQDAYMLVLDGTKGSDYVYEATINMARLVAAVEIYGRRARLSAVSQRLKVTAPIIVAVSHAEEWLSNTRTDRDRVAWDWFCSEHPDASSVLAKVFSQWKKKQRPVVPYSAYGLRTTRNTRTIRPERVLLLLYRLLMTLACIRV